MKLKSQCLLALIVFSQAAVAAVVEKANNTDPLNAPTSWVGGTAPTAADIALFDTTYATTGPLTAGATLDWSGVKVGDPGGAVIVANTNANRIVLGAAGVDLFAAADNLSIQHLGVSADQTWNIGADRSFTLGGTGTVARVGSLALFDVGSVNITKSGPGTVSLDVAENSIGNVNWNVTGGVIRALWNNASAFGSGTITLGGGGLASGTPFGFGNWTWNNPIVLTSGTDSFIDNQNSSGTDRSLGLTGDISGGGSLSFRNSAGFLGMVFNLSGNNSYTGGTTVNGGTVVFTSAASLPPSGVITVNSNAAVGGGAFATVQEWLDSGRISTTSTGAVAISGDSAAAIDFSAGGYDSLGLASTGSFTYSGALTPGTGGYIFGGGKNLTVSSELSAPTSVTKNGLATTILNRDANGYTGGTTVNTGELQALATTAAGAKTTFGTGPISVKPNARLRFKTGSTSNAISYANAIALDAATLISDDGVVTYTGPVTVDGASTINVVYANKNAVFANTVTGPGSVAKTGGGSLIFDAAGNQLAALTVSQGKISVRTGASLQIDGTYRSSSSSAKGSLDIAAGGSVTTDALFSSWGTDMAIDGTLNIATTLTFSGGTSTVTGAGTINTRTLAHTNYGTDNLNGATFNIGSGGITFNQPGALNLGATTLGATADWTTSAPMTLTANATVNTQDPTDSTAHNIAMTGVLKGTGGLTKTGAGTLTLSGANIYTGDTNVTGGTLVASGSSYATSISVGSGARLGLSGDAPLVTTGNVTFAAGSTVSVAGTPVANTTVLTAAAISGTPALSPGMAGFALEIQGGNSLVLVASDGDDFTTWIGGFTFASGADTSLTGDPDGDGMSNFAEYAFGLAPNSGASVNPIVVPLDKSTGEFRYTRRNVALTGIAYTYEYSTNLADWTAFAPATSSNGADPVETVTVDVPDSLLTNPKLFVRVLAD